MKITNAHSIGKTLLLWSISGINIIILLGLLSIWRTSDRTLNFISNLLRLQPVEPTVATSTPVVQQIQNLQELSTTVHTVETVVPASAERKLGDISLATTRLLYIARGEIRAGVDLSELTAEDIVVSERQIEIDLPGAKILDSKIDVNHSRVYDYDRGFLNLGPDVAPELQTIAQRKTLARIVNTACNEGILDRANTKAKSAITQLLSNTGERQVIVNTASNDTCDVGVSDVRT